MSNFNYFLAILFVATLVGCSKEESTTQEPNEAPLTAEVMRDVSYGPHEQQIYDIYLPEGRSGDKTKVIVLVHGGGWIEGDKADMAWYVPLLQLSHPHHAIVNMNYVLATTTTPAFPNQFLDVQQLLQKIYDEREQLQIVPEFGLIGASAGAHLSLMYDAVYDDLDHVKFVADIVGPTDLTDPFYANNPNFQFFLNAAVDESAYPPGTDYASAVSPALHVSGKSSPTILFYGNADPLVPLSNGQTLQNALSTAMVTHSFTIYEGGHGDDWSEADRADLREKLSEFISLHLSVPN